MNISATAVHMRSWNICLESHNEPLSIVSPGEFCARFLYILPKSWIWSQYVSGKTCFLCSQLDSLLPCRAALSSRHWLICFVWFPYRWFHSTSTLKMCRGLFSRGSCPTPDHSWSQKVQTSTIEANCARHASSYFMQTADVTCRKLVTQRVQNSYTRPLQNG